MVGTRLIRHLAASAGILVALGCADYATAPSSSLAPPSTTVFYRGGGSRVSAVQWASGRGGRNLSTSGWIGREGGTLTIPDADFTIVFPAGALKKDTFITIDGSSDYVGYEMQPHGLTFSKPVIATQGLGNARRSDGVFCAYLPPGADVGANGAADALEIETSTTNYGVQIAGRARAIVQVWTLNHFSRYILASGATSDPENSPPSDGQ